MVFISRVGVKFTPTPIRKHVWEPGPLGEKFARGAGSYGKTGMDTNCDLRATMRRRKPKPSTRLCHGTRVTDILNFAR